MLSDNEKKSVQQILTTSQFECPQCSKVGTCEGDWKQKVVRCEDCGQRLAFGVPVMRMVVSPHPEDTRFIQFTFEGKIPGKESTVTIAIDRKGAYDWAEAVRSLVRP
jgi:transcription elongation factor Elf1